MPAMSAARRGPDIRTTPIPPRPGAVEMAAMMSLSVFTLQGTNGTPALPAG
jgi:hypothetical protein